ncbi:uncharacterized protein PAC_05116 [Phialocephala subalpina]|uniref:alpha-L-fucosidase n=1 Tax=Phialocephala subalpina TaxID=576137 RepID=A0A1L7WR24_9HELO|nr:uncharacterized protein PAC_05116 [Phialocephala subalpina]
MHLHTFSPLLLLPLAQSQVVFNPKNIDYGSSSTNPSLPLDLSSFFNNRGFAMRPNDSNLNGYGVGYPAESLPPSSFVFNGINFTFPQYKTAGNDNVLALGQTVEVPRGRYFSVQMLASCENGLASGYIDATYADNSTSSSPVLVPAFYNWPYPAGGDIILPYYYTNTTIDYNRSMFYQTINWLDSTKELVSITLPNVTAGSNSGPGGAAVKTRLHLFSVSMLPATGSGIDLEVQYARSTQLWMEGTNKTQIVEVVINNVGQEWVLSNNSARVSISSPGYETVVPGYIKRLQPGDQVRVQVGVVNAGGVATGTVGEATVVVNGVGVDSSYAFNATYGIAPYEATYESIYSHETPNWYNEAKYGIFIHWGVYSVPGWGNVGKNETYAEWYWYDQNLGPSTPEQTYQYNLATYGPNHNYDDFIQNFTASAFNPEEWVDLFASAGANYFVQVSKHHDGYALFDLPANVTQRTSVAQYPHRNLLQELFDAAKEYQPQLHRATYFSLPEWFNPAYKEYGFGSWPGGNATNPYTNETLPYTGFIEVEDYVPDIIVPQMNALADMGTEIMWCDIGGPNMTAEFAAAWFNTAAESGRQVVMDNRCGLPGDFDTPEYARYDAVQTRKWEVRATLLTPFQARLHTDDHQSQTWEWTPSHTATTAPHQQPHT